MYIAKYRVAQKKRLTFEFLLDYPKPTIHHLDGFVKGKLVQFKSKARRFFWATLYSCLCCNCVAFATAVVVVTVTESCFPALASLKGHINFKSGRECPISPVLSRVKTELHGGNEKWRERAFLSRIIEKDSSTAASITAGFPHLVRTTLICL